MQAVLKQHEIVHSGERPYSCAECLKSFAYSQALRRHMRIHAEERKPHSCSECDEAFTEFAKLKTRMRVHSVDDCNTFFERVSLCKVAKSDLPLSQP